MYEVKITKVATGETRVHSVDSEWDDDLVLFMWEDGNYGCDCNRFLFFERAGSSKPSLEGLTCGEGAYTVLLPNGMVR